jgi:crotonobetainyl-CoA:carnitine CoA-transferase CaiB-like acyl-CoA transferase
MRRPRGPLRPLAGIRVLDLSQVLAGPYAAMLLAGLGAEVIKVEAPEGDISRSMGPPYVGGTGTLFLSVNRNKKSLVLDLKRPEGQRALHRVVASADVLLHNFRPRAARKLRLDHETLSSSNPRLIYATVAAFGADGPDADRPGLDAVAQAMGGLMSLTGPVRGGPWKAGASVVDVATGIFTALGIVSALAARERTGRGCRVGGALLDTVLALQASIFTYGSVLRRNPERVGNGSYFTLTNCFATRDGNIVISLPTSRFWLRLCRALGDRRVQNDPRFATNRGRVRYSRELARALARVFRRRSTATWLQRLRQEEVPCGPVLEYDSVPKLPQVRHNGLFGLERFGSSRPYRVVRSPVRLDGSLMDGHLPAPALGQHTREILRAAGFSAAEIRALHEAGLTVPRPVDLRAY